ncbi:sulfurtransferase [Alicyclobacillus sp. SO9]|uniref:sulfurtransferase n=1 Tax=Alicyclobacillus sp. SO9 TaxID=2665646 RepID=UPI0018E77914|nr:sulfurtransferase [Alicyclobacillus sp. SO9]QQE80225.1 sulfurtransferase [Alicyclobacillus sp. SO9]
MLTDPRQLDKWIQENSVSIFDCRFSLLDKTKGKEQYGKAHIPGALYVDLETDLSSPASREAGRHPLPNPISFAARMSELGAADDNPVVFYDNGEGMAARGWWLMRYIGHKQVYLLDGGFKRWSEEGYEVTDRVEPATAGRLTVSLQEQMIANEATVERISSAQAAGTLVDARAGVRYRGEEEPIDPKAGHIPLARNAPWIEGMDSSGRWLRPEQQRHRFEKILTGDAPVVNYCGSGVTACNNVFAMELAGRKGALLYPGSWSQWCNKAHHAVAVD